MTRVMEWDVTTGNVQTLHEDQTEEGAAAYLATILSQDRTDDHVIYLSGDAS